jgi:hypothetical protein
MLWAECLKCQEYCGIDRNFFRLFVNIYFAGRILKTTIQLHASVGGGGNSAVRLICCASEPGTENNSEDGPQARNHLSEEYS